MKVICRGRVTGRTSELIKECAKYKYAIIVAPTTMRARFIFDRALEMKINIPMPISFREFVDHKWYGKWIDAFLFDDLDASLQCVAKEVPVKTVVFCREEKQ